MNYGNAKVSWIKNLMMDIQLHAFKIAINGFVTYGLDKKKRNMMIDFTLLDNFAKEAFEIKVIDKKYKLFLSLSRLKLQIRNVYTVKSLGTNMSVRLIKDSQDNYYIGANILGDNSLQLVELGNCGWGKSNKAFQATIDSLVTSITGTK